MTIEKKFFIRTKKIEQKNTSFSSLFLEFRDQPNLPDRVLRRLLNFAVWEIISPNPSIDVESTRSWLLSHKDTAYSFDPLYSQYLFAVLEHKTNIVDQIRTKLLKADMQYGSFTAQRYIHTASIDLADWKTAALLHGKLSQYNGNASGIKAATTRTLAMLRAKLANRIFTLPQEEKWKCLWEVLQNPFPLSKENNATSRTQNVVLQNMLYGRIEKRWTYLTLNKIPFSGNGNQYFSPSFTHCADMTEEALDSWVQNISRLPLLSQQYVLRALTYTKLSQVQKETLYQHGWNKYKPTKPSALASDMGVFMLYQTGWRRNENDLLSEENSYTAPEHSVDEKEYIQALRFILMAQTKTSRCHYELTKQIFLENPNLIVHLFPEMINNLEFIPVLTEILPKVSPEIIVQNISALISFVCDIQKDANIRKSLHDIIDEHFPTALANISCSLLISYINNDIPTKKQKNNSIKIRSVEAPLNAALIDFLGNHSEDSFRKSMVAYIKRLPVTRYQENYEALLGLFFSEYINIQKFFDTHIISVFRSFISTIDRDICIRWLNTSRETFFKFAHRFQKDDLGKAFSSLCTTSPQDVLSMLNKHTPSMNRTEATILQHILRQIDAETFISHTIFRLLFTTESDEALWKWLSQTFFDLCCTKNEAAINIFHRLIQDIFTHSDRVQQLKKAKKAVFVAWFEAKGTSAITIIQEALHKNHIWLVEYVFSLLPYQIITKNLTTLLCLNNNTIHNQFQPFLQQILLQDRSLLEAAISKTLTNLSNKSNEEQKILLRNLQSQDVFAATFTGVKHKLFSIIHILMDEDTIPRSILLGYIQHASTTELHQEKELRFLLQSKHQDCRNFGWKWLEEQRIMSMDFWTSIIFEYFDYLIQHAHRSDMNVLSTEAFTKTKSHLPLIVMQNQSKSQTTVDTILTNTNTLLNPLGQLAATIACHISQEYLKTQPHILLKWMYTQNPSAHVILRGLLSEIVQDAVFARSFAILFFDYTVEHLFYNESHKEHCLTIISSTLSQPFYEEILSNPNQYIHKIRQMLSSTEDSLRDIGISILNVLPIEVLTNNPYFLSWLFFSCPEEILPFVFKSLHTIVQQNPAAFVDFTTESFHQFVIEPNPKRFKDSWPELLSLFSSSLLSIQKSDKQTYLSWLDSFARKTPTQRLHLYLFSLLPPEERLQRTDDFLSFFQSTISTEDFRSLFDGITNASDIIAMILHSTDNMTSISSVYMEEFIDLYPDDISSYFATKSGHAIFIEILSQCTKKESIFTSIIISCCRIFPASFFHNHINIVEEIFRNEVCIESDMMPTLVSKVCTQDFMRTHTNLFLEHIYQDRRKSHQNAIVQHFFRLFSTYIHPLLSSVLPTNQETWDILTKIVHIDIYSDLVLDILFRNPPEKIQEEKAIIEELWLGKTEGFRKHALSGLKKLMDADHAFSTQQILRVESDLVSLSKQAEETHLISLLENLFWPYLVERLYLAPQKYIKFIDQSILHTANERLHLFGMKLFAQFPIPLLRQHGKDFLLRSFDHKLSGVRSGILLTFEKIWKEDPQWGADLLVSLISTIAAAAKRIEIITIAETFIHKHNSFLKEILETHQEMLAKHTASFILSPQAANVELTKARFSLGSALLKKLPPQAFSQEIRLLVYLALSQDQTFVDIGNQLIAQNAEQRASFRTDIGNALMAELKSEQKFTADGANIFNFHFYPPVGAVPPASLDDYILERKTHLFPDFDEGILAPQNPHTLIGPNVDDQSKQTDIGFTFHYGGKNYRSCKVDTNGWLLFEGSFSGSTYVNNTAYQSNSASMLFLWWQDLRTAHDGYLRTWIQGEEGERIRVFEWRTFAVYTQSAASNRTLNMQICLHEGSNKIVYRFGAIEPHGNSSESRTAVCGAKLGNTRIGQFRDFFGNNGSPPGSKPPFRSDLRTSGKQNQIDYPGIIRDQKEEARFDTAVLERYKKAMHLLETYCSNVLSSLDLGEVSHLIHHPKKEIRQFGARIITKHNTPPDQFPSTLLQELLFAQDAEIQKITDVIFDKLTLQGLQNHRSLWLILSGHSASDIRKRGERYIKSILDHNTEYHLSILNELFTIYNALPKGFSFKGDNQALLNRLVTETPRESIYKAHTLIFDGYFSIHENLSTLFIEIAHNALSFSRHLTFLFWDTLLQKEQDKTITKQQKTGLTNVTQSVEIHIRNVQAEDLRVEDWWFPRLTSPIRTVRATMAPLLGIYAKSYPALAIECAKNLLASMHTQVEKETVDGIPPKYDDIRGRAAVEILCADFPNDKRVDYCFFWLAMFLHLHPEIRERGKVELLQLLTDKATDSDYKRVLDMLLRELLKGEPFQNAHKQITAFIAINISSRLYLVSERILFRLLDSRSKTACSFGLQLMRQKFSPERISLHKMILLSGYDFIDVRSYAWELMRASIDRFKADFAQTIRFLEVKWDDTRQVAFDICREHLLESWNIENIIRVCDSVRTDVRDFGLEQLHIFLLGADYEQKQWSQGNQQILSELAQRLSQHPSIEVEEFLLTLFEQHHKEENAPPLLGRPEQLGLLIPCFKRIFSRVNKGRDTKEILWTLLETRALESQANAEALYPLLSWMSGTHLKKDKVKAIRLMMILHLQFEQLKIEQEQPHLVISHTSVRPLST